MATASPTPAPAGQVRRVSQRQASLRRPPSRLLQTRQVSEPPAAPGSSQQHKTEQANDGDSSEDEIPVPMQLSALTKALLNDGGEVVRAAQPSPPRTRRQANLSSSTSSATESRRHLRSGSMQANGSMVSNDSKTDRPSSPVQEKENNPPRKRVIRLSNTPQGLGPIHPSKRRSTSASRPNGRTGQPPRPSSRSDHRDASGEQRQEYNVDINTPGQPERVVRIVTGSSGNRSRVGSSGPSSGRSHDRSAVDRSQFESDQHDEEDPEAVARNAPPVSVGSIANPQGSMRIKRTGKIAGSFLSGPARRGRRRQSDEDDGQDGEVLPDQEPESQLRHDPAASSIYADGFREFNSGSPVSNNAAARAESRKQRSGSELREVRRSRSPPAESQVHVQEDNLDIQIPPPKVALPSTHDQENEVPSTFKKSKPLVDDLFEKQLPSRPLNVEVNLAKTASPERKPLSTVEKNTPHRHAPPPPPKMSILDAATSNAGASTATQKQRRNVLRVNGKCYTRLDCLGRGGSAKVYRVTAENGKMCALKRVALENADEATIKGYRGEIDLLGKLAGVERVINLFDHEMNSEKQVLTLVWSSFLALDVIY